MSFDLLSGRPDEPEGPDSPFPDFEPPPVIFTPLPPPVIPTPYAPGETPPPLDPDEGFEVFTAPPTQVQRQPLLPGASTPAPTTLKSSKRCAVCVKAFCLERHKCPGRSKKKLCPCKHPRMASGDRARISEETILGYWAQRLPSSGSFPHCKCTHHY